MPMCLLKTCIYQILDSMDFWGEEKALTGEREITLILNTVKLNTETDFLLSKC